MQKSKNDEAIASQVEMELVEGETLLWADKPDPMAVALSRRYLWEGAIGLLWLAIVTFIFNGFGMFSMFGSGFGGFGMSGGLTSGIFSLFPLIFYGIGLWQVSSPLRAYLGALRTTYAVTSNRALIMGGLFSNSTKSYGPHQMEFIEMTMNGNGTGNIIFDREMRTSSYRNRSGFRRTRQYTVDVGFFGVHNPREVEALMLREFTQIGSGREKPKHESWFDHDPLQI